MAIIFPVGPSIGDLYPPDPGVSGVTQYRFDGSKWNAVPSVVSLGTANQGAFNNYTWPAADDLPNQQLTTDGAGNLVWDVAAAPSMQILKLDGPFDGARVSFTLEDAVTSAPVSPAPSTNLIVFLGGVPQLPGPAYSVSGFTITFTEAPLAGTTFYAVTNVIA